MKKRTLILWILIPTFLVVLLLVALIVAAIWLFPAGGGEAADGKGGSWSSFGLGSSGTRVRVFKARRGTIVATTSAPGIVTPAREVAITSRLAGRVQEIFADEGHQVEENQIIAKLEPKDFEIALERARSDLDVAQARLVQVTASQVQAGVSARRSLAELQRKEALHEKGAVSDSEIDQARNQADRDRLAKTVAEKNVRETEEAARAATLAMEKVERELAETDIRSPLAGTVTARNVNIGERVILGIAGDPSAALFVVSDLSEILIYASVDESDVAQLEPEQPVKITTEALKDVEFSGLVIDVAPRARRTGEVSTFRTRVLVEGDTSQLRPGMSAQVEIEVQRSEAVLILPIEAVVERSKEDEDDEEKPEGKAARGSKKPKKKEYEQVVFRVEEGKVTKCTVKTGISDNIYVEILEGVQEGETIVSGPYRALDDLKDGNAVKVTETLEAGDQEDEEPEEGTDEPPPETEEDEESAEETDAPGEGEAPGPEREDGDGTSETPG